MKHLVFIPLLLLSLIASPSLGQDYDKGMAAYDGGDYEAAIREWTPLAEQGDAQGQYGLGAAYFWGKGIEQDYERAAKWLKLSAEQGYPLAQHMLAIVSLHKKDYINAYMWSNIAVSNGVAESVMIRDVASIITMTPADISAAQKRTRECVAKNYKGC